MTGVTHSSDRRSHERRHLDPPRPLAVEDLVRETHTILARSHVPISPSKTSRLVRTYTNRVAAKGIPFADFILNSVLMSSQQRGMVESDLYRLTYRDPTGERAVRNLMRATP